MGDSPYFTCLKGSSWRRVFCCTSLAPPYSHLPPTPCHHEFILIVSVLPFFLTGNTSSAPYSPGLSTTLTFGKNSLKWRGGEGITAPGLAPRHSPTNSSLPHWEVFQAGFYLPEGQGLNRSPRKSRAELLKVCVWDCRDGWDLHKGQTLLILQL